MVIIFNIATKVGSSYTPYFKTGIISISIVSKIEIINYYLGAKIYIPNNIIYLLSLLKNI